MSTHKNFKSADGTEKYIASTMGWTFRIGKDWTPIPEVAWNACYGAGCVSEDMIKNSTSAALPKSVVDNFEKMKSREDLITTQMREWYDSNDISKFDKSGKPKTLELRSALHITVTRSERDKLWSNLQEELK